jgi:hypothetical protein
MSFACGERQSVDNVFERIVMAPQLGRVTAAKSTA